MEPRFGLSSCSRECLRFCLPLLLSFPIPSLQNKQKRHGKRERWIVILFLIHRQIGRKKESGAVMSSYSSSLTASVCWTHCSIYHSSLFSHYSSTRWLFPGKRPAFAIPLYNYCKWTMFLICFGISASNYSKLDLYDRILCSKISLPATHGTWHLKFQNIACYWNLPSRGTENS